MKRMIVRTPENKPKPPEKRARTTLERVKPARPDPLPGPVDRPVLGDSTIFLACADLHVRDDTPVCRTDDYQAAQTRKLAFLFDIARELSVPVLVAGDVFDRWNPSHRLVAQMINLSRRVKVIVVPGQHDLPQHNLELLYKSGLWVLKEAGWTVLWGGEEFILQGNTTIGGYAFGEDPPKECDSDILLWHKMTWVGKVAPYPGCKEPDVSRLLKQFPKVKMVITGDNHQTFSFYYLLNPGSMMRMAVDQIDHTPSFFAVDKNLCSDPIRFPIEQGVITDEHLVRAEERDERLESFVSRISGDMEVGLSFEENMHRFLATNKTDLGVVNLINKSMEG